jgi:hypothetical protein
MHPVDSQGSALYVSHQSIRGNDAHEDETENYVLDRAIKLHRASRCLPKFAIRFWFTTTRLEKILMLATSVLSTALLCWLIAGVVAGPVTMSERMAANATSNSNVCLTPECVLTAARVLSKMDTATDPCGDFYQFACGRWIRETPIPEHKSRYGAFDALDESQQVRFSCAI